MIRKFLVTGVAVLALALTACGENEKYAKAVNEAQMEFAADMDKVAGAEPSATVVTNLRSEINDLASRLGKIDAPDQVKDEHQNLVNSVIAAGRDLTGPALSERIKVVQGNIRAVNAALN